MKQKRLNQAQKKSDEIVLLPMHCAPPWPPRVILFRALVYPSPAPLWLFQEDSFPCNGCRRANLSWDVIRPIKTSGHLMVLLRPLRGASFPTLADTLSTLPTLIAATALGNLPQKLTEAPHCAQDGKSDHRDAQLQNSGHWVDRPMYKRCFRKSQISM